MPATNLKQNRTGATKDSENNGMLKNTHSSDSLVTGESNIE